MANFELAVFASYSERDCGFGTRALDIEVAVVRRNPEDDAPHGLHPHDFADTDPRRGVPSIVLALTYYSDDPARKPWSAFRVRDSIDRADLAYIRDIAASDRFISRGIARLGSVPRPAHESTLVHRFAEVVGAKGLIRRNPGDPNVWQWLPIASLSYAIHSLAEDFRERHAELAAY